MTGTATDRFELRRALAAPPAEVWAAWTEAERMRRWMAPPGCQVERLDADVRPGGHYRLQMVTPGGTMVAVGAYRDVVVAERLSYTWRWEGMEMRDSLVEVEFAGDGTGTIVILRHGPFDSPESAESHREGWTGCLAMLERYLAET